MIMNESSASPPLFKPEDFQPEMDAAIKTFDLCVVSLKKTPDEFRAALGRLMVRAIEQFINLPAGKVHGIALDRDVTIILSQRLSEPRPYCNIYFNLHSDYHLKMPRVGKLP